MQAKGICRCNMVLFSSLRAKSADRAKMVMPSILAAPSTCVATSASFELMSLDRASPKRVATRTALAFRDGISSLGFLFCGGGPVFAEGSSTGTGLLGGSSSSPPGVVGSLSFSDSASLVEFEPIALRACVQGQFALTSSFCCSSSAPVDGGVTCN